MVGKKAIGIGLIIICPVLLGLGVWYYVYSQRIVPAAFLEETISPEPVPEEVSFGISGKEDVSPTFFKEVKVNPFKTENGSQQTFSIWAKDGVGVSAVSALIKTDSKERTLTMELREGTLTEGRWEGAWTVEDISANNAYETVFKAANLNGEEVELTLTWYHK